MLFGLFGKRQSRDAAHAATLQIPSRDTLVSQAREHVARGHFAAAEVCLEQLLAADPADVVAHNELGLAHYANSAFAEAEAAFRTALGFEPGFTAALVNLGQSLQARGRFGEAREHFETALALAPGHAMARFDLAVALYALGEVEPARALLARLVEEHPEDSTYHFALGECLLRLEQFSAGWEHYEWRHKALEYKAFFREYAQPQWDGREHAGAKVLLWPEQGYGDALQFMRLARVAALQAPSMSFVLEVPPALLRITKHSFRDRGNVTVLVSGTATDGITHHCSVMSLARLMSIGLSTNPVDGPYLEALPADCERWRGRVADVSGGSLKVGLVWAGSPRPELDASEQAVDARRSVGAAHMAELLDVPGCRFFSLQVRAGATEMGERGAALVDWTGDLTDFAETAALIANLDLVITVDTSVAHLAGGMGMPVWMLSRFDCCWRWGSRRAVIPWYPAMRTFYQPEPGQWRPVMVEVAQALEQLAAARGDKT